jgi:PTS system glucose-specific IIA component
MFKKLFGTQSKKTEIVLAPVTGRIIPIEQVPDPTFAEKMLGEGVAIDPTEGEIVAPVDGEIISLFPTKHAMGIKSNNGLEILIHIGLDTVKMQGEGFETFVQVGDKVSAGTTLIRFSTELIQRKASSIITPVVITNSEKIKQLDVTAQGNVKRGETELMKIVIA